MRVIGFVGSLTPLVVDQTLAVRDAAWALARFAPGFTLSFDPSIWVPKRAWEQDGAMSCGIRFLDENGNGIDGLHVEIGWPGVVIQAETRQGGWVDVPISGGDYSNGPGSQGAGPMFIRTADGTLSYVGIGWVRGTNHSHLNLDVQRGRFVPPVEPPVIPPITPPGAGEPLVRITVDVPGSMSATFQTLAQQASNVAGRVA